MKTFFQGISVGMALQIAIGPVFFFIMGLALKNGPGVGLAAVLGVTLVDYLFILLALAGLGVVFENEQRKRIFGLAASIVLMIFGALMVQSGLQEITVQKASPALDPWQGFLSAFLLTISSPLTIVFWMSVFASKSLELGLTRRQQIIFGLGAGLATFLFLGTASLLVSLGKQGIPESLAAWGNLIIGIIIMVYAISRLIQGFFKKEKPS